MMGMMRQYVALLSALRQCIFPLISSIITFEAFIFVYSLIMAYDARLWTSLGIQISINLREPQAVVGLRLALRYPRYEAYLVS